VIVLVMGVSGSGKSTIGELLAKRLNSEFIDADQYHPPENVKKMAAGIPLEDADRWPWLDRLNALLKAKRNAVLACSALKEIYRKRLLDGVGDHRVVYLTGSPELIGERVAARKHRYMPASLLKSQFETLEPPHGAIEIDVAGTPEQCVAAIVARL
jgi:carbohydrate kinase (thermoresistant glucokinase family)